MKSKRPYNKAQLSEKYNEGLSYSELAIHFNIGRKIIQNDMKEFGIKARGQHARNQKGENNNNWKGDQAGYSALHRRLYHSQPMKCEECGTSDPSRRYQWASLTGNYSEPSDYKRMCQSCHARYDKIILNINKMRTKN